MPSPLEAAGAQIQPTSAAPLHVNEFFTGLWTNGSPFGPGAVPFLYARFYGASRYDRLVGGSDMEISPRLTPIRRPGHTVYNPGPFPPINRFFEFRALTATDEFIHLLADCDAPTDVLVNGDFSGGTTGWVFQPGWSLGSATGIGPLAIFLGPGTAAVENTTQIPCVAGEVVNANCQALGEPGATGAANLRITFYDAGGTAIGFSHPSANVPANYIWTTATVSQTAPTGTAWAIIDFAVTGSTSAPRWAATTFYAATGSTGSPTVREVTQPSTNTILWEKNPAAGRTGFVSVGNIIYAGDGYNLHQWVTSGQSWTANTQWLPGQFIIDPNGNIQMAVGSITATIVNIQVDDVILSGGLHGRKVTLFFLNSTPFDVPDNIAITTSGLTTVPAANETTPYTVIVTSVLQCSWVEATTTIPITAYAVETGAATTGSGVSGATPPTTWNTALGLVTQDGGNQWINMGSAIVPWGAPGPTTAPHVTTTGAPTTFPLIAVSTWYSPSSFVIQDSNGNLQQLVVGGATGSAAPTWSATVGAITNDGGCQWKCLGGSAWQANHAYAVGDTIKVTYTYTTVTYQWTSDGHGGFIQVPVNTQVTTTSFFQALTAGLSGANQPNWLNGISVVTTDNQVQWKNNGPTGSGSSWPGATLNLSTATQVVDPLGYFQTATKQGETGATPPGGGYNTATGGTTNDGTQIWTNAGPYSPAATEAWHWAYSGKSSITGAISNASPISAPLIPGLGQVPVIQGQGLAEPPWDTIVLWRTAAGGSTLLYNDEFPNPGPNSTWIYTDTTLDPGNVATGGQGTLNPFITAPISGSNDPPPSNFVPQCYYLGRIWGYCNNVLRWTGGPDTTTGDGNSTMPGVNQFTLTSKGVVCWPTSVGLICFTTTDIWAVLGQGTDASPFYVVNFQQGVGIASADAFGVNGSTAYTMLTSHQVVSIDPGAGELEVGFPIADLFDTVMDPNLAYITWHQGRSADTALYVANGSDFWYRMAAVSAPESGNVWSPVAQIHSPGQVRAMASIEITPGEKKLILGPNVDGNPILMRDPSVRADNGVTYPAEIIKAPVVLAQPGTTAGVQFVVTEEKAIDGSTPLSVEMLFDEMLDYVHVGVADLRLLRNRSNDPPNLPKQKSVTAQRLWGSQDPSTVIKCRFYQEVLSWPAEDYPNELYTDTVYGRLPEKARK